MVILVILIQQEGGIVKRKYPPVKDLSKTPELLTSYVGPLGLSGQLGIQTRHPFTLHLTSGATATKSQLAVSPSHVTRLPLLEIWFPLFNCLLSHKAVERPFQNTVHDLENPLLSETLLNGDTLFCMMPSCLSRNPP